MTQYMNEAVLFTASKHSDKQRYRILFLFNLIFCPLFLWLAISSPFAMYATTKGELKSNFLPTAPGHLTAITLNFNKTHDQKLIEHNCASISRTKHDYVIYTDDPSQAYCSTCMCIRFTSTNCKCHDSSQPDCSLCEKLRFIKGRVEELAEFVFLDSDLIILNDQFMDRLFARSRDFDFLASYGFGDPCLRNYQSPFNSGLFFIRRLSEVRYSDLITKKWGMETNNDQNTISKFIHAYYKDWDSLSLKWHCRFLARRDFGIHPEECYTLHGRGSSVWDALKEINKTLLTVQ